MPGIPKLKISKLPEKRDDVGGFFFTSGQVVRRVDNGIQSIRLYPVDGAVCFVNTYLLDNDLTVG